MTKYLFQKGNQFSKGNHPKTEFKKGQPSWSKGKKLFHLRGKNAAHWRGGIKIIDGYKYIYSSSHPFATKQHYVAEHRLVMEKHLNRFLKHQEQVHHINRNILDNRIKNLMLFKNGAEHTKYHTADKKY